LIEPRRQTDIDALVPYVRDCVVLVLRDLSAAGWDPFVIEVLRSEARQTWLYGIGRTHSLRRRPVTWTHHSLHLVGKAVDIISQSHGWTSLSFFEALKTAAWAHGLHVNATDRCHVEWRG